MEENGIRIDKTSLVKKAKLILIGVLIGVILSVIFALVITGRNKAPDKEILNVTNVEDGKSKEQEVTIEYIDKKLENISELSTAEMIYTNLYTVTEGKIPFLTQKGFSMVYTATVQAGIDVSEIKTEIDDKKVTVTLPPVKIQEPNVLPDSIQFYDEKHALFNWDKKTDVTTAISLAANDVKEKANTDGLEKQAAQRAELIVEGLLKDSVGDRVVVVKHG